MNTLVIGSGAREHALIWKISQSEKCKKIYACPGNAGTKDLAENVSLSINNTEIIGDFIVKNEVDILIIGPEQPLVDGLVDKLKKYEDLERLIIVGPSMEGAKLEGSKDFAKDFMIKNNIPTAKYSTFSKGQLNEAIEFMKELRPPYVLKADGLAAGKGVLIIDNIDEASEQLRGIFEGRFGAAGNKVVIEEFLKGIELSVFILTDGDEYFILPEAKDYKRIGEGDTGLNTGGMGAVSPVPFSEGTFMDKIENKIIKPTINGLKKYNIDYKGFVFIGLMNVGGEPYVIEYNVRMGDPETEVVMPRLNNDVIDLFIAMEKGGLNKIIPDFNKDFCVTTVVVSGGYPGDYEKGYKIKGLDTVNNGIVFHAGTSCDDSGSLVTNGGRVFAITNFADNKDEALKKTYLDIDGVYFKDLYYRKDIGFDI